MQANQIFLYKITELKTDACVLKFYFVLAAGRSRHLLLKVCLMHCFLVCFIPTSFHVLFLVLVTAYIVADNVRDKKAE